MAGIPYPLPQSPPFFLPLNTLIPFDACYAGYE